MKCEKCGYSDNGTGDWAHVCGPVKIKESVMNERIKELSEQCYHRYSVYYIDLEKFAELIVRECADIINHRADTCSDWLDSVKANEAVREGQRECAKTIKEHFGVEE